MYFVIFDETGAPKNPIPIKRSFELAIPVADVTFSIFTTQNSGHRKVIKHKIK